MRTPTKYSDIRSRKESPGERYPGVEEKLDEIARLSDRQYSSIFKAFRIGGGELYSVDMLLSSVVSRSLEIIESYIDAMEKWSLGVASALVRMQVDNVLRCHLFAVTPNPDEVLNHLLSGEPLEKLVLPEGLTRLIPEEKRQRGMRHRDVVLRILASRELDWVDEAYKVGSSWVHHSSAHLMATFKVGDNGTIAGRIPADVEGFDEDFIRGLIDAMAVSSEAIVRYLEGWILKKEERVSR